MNHIEEGAVYLKIRQSLLSGEKFINFPEQLTELIYIVSSLFKAYTAGGNRFLPSVEMTTTKGFNVKANVGASANIRLNSSQKR